MLNSPFLSVLLHYETVAGSMDFGNIYCVEFLLQCWLPTAKRDKRNLLVGNASDKISNSQRCVLPCALHKILLSLFPLFTYTAKIIPIKCML